MSGERGDDRYIDNPQTAEVYATDLHHCEIAGPCLRLAFAVDKWDVGGRYAEAVIYVILPLSAVDDARARLATAAAGKVIPHSLPVDAQRH